MDESKKQLIDKLKGANNILVTVGRDPSADQLASLLGLTLFLNKQGKHAAAVFSGEVPSTLEFLKPEETIEKNTDSLRDFIIALDKTKADKLRYKVEDDVVRIFITPYKTSISQDDFEFSQGDFNVDMVVTLGVQNQDDLDEAILAHGRILHDATVASVTTTPEGGIGTINWHDPSASSLSELVCELVQEISQDLLDEQISTAILTGIVAETDRFSNEKTTARTMSASAVLMGAGANQQLVASKLQEEPVVGPVADGDVPEVSEEEEAKEAEAPPEEPKNDDGTLEISHEDHSEKEDQPELELPEPDEHAPEEDESTGEDINLDNEQDSGPDEGLSGGPKLMTEPPTLGGTLTSNTKQEELDPATDPLSLPAEDEPKILSRKDPIASLSMEPTKPEELEKPAEEEPASVESEVPVDLNPLPPAPEPEPPLEAIVPSSAVDSPAASGPADDTGSYSTLADLEESVGSPHAVVSDPIASTDDTTPAPLDTAHLDAARDEVSRALNAATIAGDVPPQPIQALNAQPMATNLNSPLHPQPSQSITPSPVAPTQPFVPAPLPSQDSQQPQSGPQVVDPTAPPPVPPPMPFQFGQQPKQ